MDTRTRIIDAMLRLLADRPFEAVTLRAIAREADVSLSTLAATFPTRGDILAAYTRQVDDAVLNASFDDMADQPPRERLFDVLMTRIETLRPNREAIATLLKSARRDPQLALFLNGLQLTSMRWMLEAASITPKGWQGRAALQAMSLGFANVLRVFASEDDPGLPRTMAALDTALREAERRHKRLSRFFGSAVDAEPPVPDAPHTSNGAEPVAADVGGMAAEAQTPLDPPAASGEDSSEPPAAGLP